jgi:microcystin-dependent protein
MSEPYIGEIRMFAGNFAPDGWLFCQGQLLSISENSVLFSLLGTTYGGDGQSTFALPDLRSRVPLHQGQGPGLGNYVLGQAGGVETVTLLSTHMPSHTHPVVVSSNPATTGVPSISVTLAVAGTDIYIAESASGNMNSGSISSIGGSQPHENIQPILAISFIISLFGIFPPQP